MTVRKMVTAMMLPCLLFAMAACSPTQSVPERPYSPPDPSSWGTLEVPIDDEPAYCGILYGSLDDGTTVLHYGAFYGENSETLSRYGADDFALVDGENIARLANYCGEQWFATKEVGPVSEVTYYVGPHPFL